MKLEVGDLLTIEDKEYLTMDIILYEGANYLFTNEIINEEPTQHYTIFKQEDDEVVEITDSKIINVILPIFNSNIQKLITESNLIEKYEID